MGLGLDTWKVLGLGHGASVFGIDLGNKGQVLGLAF